VSANSNPAKLLPTAEDDAIHQLELDLKETFSPLIKQCKAAWRRNLPTLLKSHAGQWVAYKGDQQLGIGRTKTDLFQRCLQEGLERGQFLVLRIEPDPECQVTG
jgi:hypothetical protein